MLPHLKDLPHPCRTPPFPRDHHRRERIRALDDQTRIAQQKCASCSEDHFQSFGRQHDRLCSFGRLRRPLPTLYVSDAGVRRQHWYASTTRSVAALLEEAEGPQRRCLRWGRLRQDCVRYVLEHPGHSFHPVDTARTTSSLPPRRARPLHRYRPNSHRLRLPHFLLHPLPR
jgi:hypothetical protein